MLKQINLQDALQMVNNKRDFARIFIEEFKFQSEKYLGFEVISEYGYDNGCINWSRREGDITDRIKQMNLFDVFYDEDFQTDGMLVHINDYPSILRLLKKEDSFENVWLSKENKFYLTDGNMEEISKLPKGLYTMIKE